MMQFFANNRFWVIVNLCMLTAISYMGVRVFYSTLAKDLPANTAYEVQVASPETGTSASRKNPEKGSYQIISKRNLFDTKAEDSSPADQVDVSSLKTTGLNLKLWGTIAGGAESSYAIIEDKTAKQQGLYKVGDQIQQAVIKLVLREKVVLTVDGGDEILEIEADKYVSPASSGNNTGSDNKANVQVINLARKQVDDAIQDVNGLMTQVRVRPHFQNGQQDGLSISHVKPGSIFRKMGLRSGDIITGVDGTEIRSVDDALKLYENLKSSSGIDVQIKRRGQQKTLRYSIQ